MDASTEVQERLTHARKLGAQSRWGEACLILSGTGSALDAVPEAVYFLAEVYVRVGNPEPARTHALRALEAFRQAGRVEEMLRAATLLGIIAFDTGDLAEARARFLTAVGMAMAAGDRAMTCRLWNNLGAVHTLQEEHEQAVEAYERALQLCGEISDPHVEAETLQNLGILLYRNRGDLDRAEGCFARAAQAAQQAGNVRQLACALAERAQVAYLRGQVGTAEQMARMALLRFDVTGNLAGTGGVFKLLGVLTREREVWDEAQRYLEKARSQAELAGNALLLAEVAYEMGLLLARTGEVDGARERLEAAATAFDRLGANSHAVRAREGLASA